ncbi:hypothetical protein [Thiohalorhabdus sp.]|uniref:hypothetical protein n=1 Tax=Thiohalorhabdus sp. TaxID=3094134 RepID=UPI002FC2C843
MSEFEQRYWGNFRGCIRWSDADQVADRVATSPGPWYAALPEAGSGARVVELTPDEAAERLRQRLAEMRRLKRGDYCNLVFVDEPEAPSLIKAFHPKRAGDACRVGGNPIPPWDLISDTPIDPAVFASSEPPAQAQGIWQRVLRIGS